MSEKIKKFFKNSIIYSTIIDLLLIVWKKVKSNTEAIDKKGLEDQMTTIDSSISKATIYERVIKRGLDVILSFCGIVILSPLFILLSVAIFIDDPGPIIFKQKRVGLNKNLFKLYKFRSMTMYTPHDVPTHQLSDPEQYITRVGKFLRKSSLDELPQLFNIFAGDISVVGPRPALWNQDDLILERDKYDANSVMPGLTGYAQINGRDELEIPVKAKYDGEYVSALRKNSLSGLIMDIKCFFGTFVSVIKSDGVVEGGTAELNRDIGKHYIYPDVDTKIGFDDVNIDYSVHRKVLVTGANSYIGESFEKYAKEHYGNNFEIDTVDMIDGSWRDKSFAGYDTVFHVAGIAHADVGNVSDDVKKKYYEVNTRLAVETAKKAKEDGVKQFVFMSSMIIYGDSAPYGKEKIITENTIPTPSNFYGDSKWQADKGVRGLATSDFQVAVLRPPMIYGKGSKGNYPILVKIAKKTPIFPNIDNKRSMLYIDNLCEFLTLLMLLGKGGIFFPQNSEYMNTAETVKKISLIVGKKIWITKLFNPLIIIGSCIPGKIGRLINKAFGNICYEKSLSNYKGIAYNLINLKESIRETEGGERKKTKHILIVSQYFYPETFRINDIAKEWVLRGYKVTVLTGIPNYPEGKFYKGYGYKLKRKENWEGINIIRIPIIPRGSSAVNLFMNYFSFVISGYFWVKKCNIDADYVFTFEVSPMTQALVGCWIGKKLNVPHYIYVQDLWPENVKIVAGINNVIIIKILDYMVDYIYDKSEKIFTTSQSFADNIINRQNPVNPDKVHVWPQYAEDFYKPVNSSRKRKSIYNNEFRIIFTGNIGVAQGIDILPKTALLLKNKGYTNVKFVIVGDGRYKKELIEMIDCYNVSRMFELISRQPAERIPELLSLSDAAFLSFQKNELWSMTIPAKLQSYLACGIPVIASAAGETKRIIENAHCGICCRIGDDEDLCDGIIAIMNMNLQELGENSLKYYVENFNKEKILNNMDTYFV